MAGVGTTECSESLISAKIVAIVRIDDANALADTVRALVRGGIKAVEIALNSPGALGAIAASVKEMGDRALIGAGTALDAQTTRAAINAGARFILSPVFKQEVLSVCKAHDIVCIPGAYTPTEIFAAWEAGADFVKVFPAGRLGVSYVKDVLAPLPHVRLAPVGGVDLDNIEDFLKAGARFVGIGSTLVIPALVAARNWDEIAARAACFVKAVKGVGAE